MLGLLLGRTGADGSEVAAEFREAIRLRPDYAEAHNNLGLVLVQAGDDEAGIAALREAVRLGPDYADAHANLGAALTPTDAAEAIRELEKAVALAPTSVKAQFNLAVAYGASPSRGPAKEIEQLRKVIALAPTFARAHLALGKALLQRARCLTRSTALQEAARLEPAERRSALSAGSGAGARRPEGGGRRGAPEGPRARGRRRSRRRTRTWTSPKGAPRSRAATSSRRPPSSVTPSSSSRSAERSVSRRRWRGSTGLAATKALD